MDSNLIAYFTSTHYSDDGANWINQVFLDRIDKSPTQHDIDVLNHLLQKNILDQELYDKYINHYVPLNNIYETILKILLARKYMQYETNPYYPEFDRHDDCITKSYASYGYDNNNTESKYFRSGDIIHLNIQNIHYIPLDVNDMSDVKKYKYTFGKIEAPMAFEGQLFENRDGILASLKIGNIVRCVFKKELVGEYSSDRTGNVWYFNIIQIIDSTIYGLLNDPYYDPKEYNLNEGDILIFHKDNITEIPHNWSVNINLNHYKVLDVGYSPTGCVCNVDGDAEHGCQIS